MTLLAVGAVLGSTSRKCKKKLSCCICFVYRI